LHQATLWDESMLEKTDIKRKFLNSTFGVSTENLVIWFDLIGKLPLLPSSAISLFIYICATTSLATLNHHLFITVSNPIIMSRNSCVTLNKSVLNWTQVCHLLHYSSKNPIAWNTLIAYNSNGWRVSKDNVGMLDHMMLTIYYPKLYRRAL
jgi:hypothetical protein